MVTNMVKILRVSNPIISVRPPIAALLSIIQNIDGWEKWLFNNYSLLYTSVGPDFTGVDIAGNSHLRNQREWYSCPYIHKYLYPAYCANSIYSNICEMIEKMIDDDEYVFLTINEKYINLFKQSRDLKHELFIYGYNSDKQFFMCRDFWKGHYKSANIPYNQILCAFENYSGFDDAIGGIAGWKLRSQKECVLSNKNDEFNLHMLYNNIYRYLFPATIIERDIEQTDACYWGIDTYIGIQRILEIDKFLSITDAYAVWAHKFLLKLSLEYCARSFEQLRIYVDIFDNIVNEAYAFLLQNLRQSVRWARNLSIMPDESMLKILSAIESNERIILRKTLNEIMKIVSTE